VRCERPPPTPPPPANLIGALRVLFAYHASIAPREWLRESGIDTELESVKPLPRVVEMAGFVAAMHSTHLCALSSQAMAGFLHANRNKATARVGPSGFWSSLFFTFVKMAAVKENSWEHNAEKVLAEIGEALLALQWNRQACDSADGQRAALAAMAAAEAHSREDQGRAQLQGDRWVLATAKPAPPGARGSAVKTSVHMPHASELDGGSGLSCAALQQLPALEGTGALSERRQAYLQHMQAVWSSPALP